MTHNIEEEKSLFLEELEHTDGNISAAARSLGICLCRIVRYRKEDKEFNTAIEEIKEAVKVCAEDTLQEIMNGTIGDERDRLNAVKFYLKTKGGYSESKNLNINSSNTVDINTVLEEFKEELS